MTEEELKIEIQNELLKYSKEKKVENGMIGMQIGETREIDVTYKKDDENIFFAGKTVCFKIKLMEITMYIQPKLSEKFLEKNYGFHTKREFYDYVYNKTIEIEEELIKDEIKEKLIKKVISKTKFDGEYKKMCKDKYDELMEKYSNYAEAYGLSLEDTLSGFQLTRELVKENAEYDVASWEVCKYILKKEDLYLSGDKKKKMDLLVVKEDGYSNVDEYIKENGQATLDKEVYMEVVLNFLYENASIYERK